MTVLSEFLIALGYRVDKGSEQAAINSGKRVEQEIVAADKRRTSEGLREAAKRATREARERGERQKGAAAHIAELKQGAAAESAAADNSLKAQAKRALAAAKTAEERFKWSRRLVALEKAEQREKDKVAADAHREEQRRQDEAYRAALTRSHATQAIVRGLIGFTAGLATAATTAFGVVAKVADKFEGTYFTAKRTGASSTGVRAFSFAAEQTGSSDREAVGGLEELAHKFKASPGFEKMVQDLGVTTRDASGKMREFTQIYMDLGEALSKKPTTQKLAFANALGVPGHLLDAITNPEFRKQYAEYVKMLSGAGLDPAKADANSKAFMDLWRRMSATISIIVTKIEGELVGSFGDKVKEFADYLLANADPIAKGAIRIGEAILKLVEGVASFVKKLGEGDNKASLDGFSKSIDGLAIAFGALAAVLTLRLLSPLAKAVGLLTTIGGMSVPAWLLRVLGVPAAIGLAASGGGHMTPDGYKEALAADPGRAAADAELNKQGGAGKRWVQERWQNAKDYLGSTAIGRALGIGQTSATEPSPTSDRARVGRAQRDANALAIMDEFKKAGYPDIGVAALMGSAQTESSFNPKAANDIKGGHTGLFQWDSTRWPKVAAWIKGQGGDPFDARWQARAMVAELDAKPGEKMYDHRRTQLGGQILRNPNDLTHAMEGVRHFERYGVGEEGNRGANARAWLPYVTGEKTMAMPKVAPQLEQAGTLPDGAPAVLKPDSMKNAPGETMAEADARRKASSLSLQKAREAAKDFNDRFTNGSVPMMDLKNSPFKNSTPLGLGSSNSTDNRSYKGGDVHLKIEASGVDGKDIADASLRVWRNENAETLRNMRSAFA